MSGAGAGWLSLLGVYRPPKARRRPRPRPPAGATVTAENGATPHQLMAIFGWNTLAQAELTSSPPPGHGHLGRARMQARSLWGGT